MEWGHPNYERIYAKIVPEPNSGCWLWVGAQNDKGYGVCRYPTGGSRVCNAHRVVYEIERGEITPGMDLDHTCRNPRCVNPDHLDIVTRAENLRRGIQAAVARARMLGNQLWRRRKTRNLPAVQK